MKHAHRSIIIMAAIHLLLGTVGIWAAVKSGLTGEYFGPPLLMLGPSQGALLGLWAAFGGRGSPWRAVLAVLVVVGHYTLNDRYVHSSDMGFWLSIQSIQAIPFILGCLLLRLLGLELTEDSGERLLSDSPGLQFSIGRTIAWMTAIAIFVFSMQFLGDEYLVALTNLPDWAVPAATGLVAIASFWTILGRKRLVVRLLALAVAIGLGTFILRKGVGYLSMEWFALILACEAIWVLCSLIVVRRAGYHWTWRWRFRKKRPTTTG